MDTAAAAAGPPPRTPVALVPQAGGPAPCRAPRVALHGAATKGPAQEPQHPGWGRPLPPPPAPPPLRRRPGAPRDAVSAGGHPRRLPPAADRGSLPPRTRPRFGCLRGAPARPAPAASGRGREGALGAAQEPSRRRLRRHAPCRAGGLRSPPRGRSRLPAAGGPRTVGARGARGRAAGCSRAARRPRASRSRAPACSWRARSHSPRPGPRRPSRAPAPQAPFPAPAAPASHLGGCTYSRRLRRHRRYHRRDCSTPSSLGAAPGICKPGLCCPLPARAPPAAVGVLTCVHVGEHTRVSGAASPEDAGESPLAELGKRAACPRGSLAWEARERRALSEGPTRPSLSPSGKG